MQIKLSPTRLAAARARRSGPFLTISICRRDSQCFVADTTLRPPGVIAVRRLRPNQIRPARGLGVILSWVMVFALIGLAVNIPKSLWQLYGVGWR